MKLSRHRVEGVAHRDVGILGVVAIHHELLVARRAHVDANLEFAALVLVPGDFLDGDAAAA